MSTPRRCLSEKEDAAAPQGRISGHLIGLASAVHWLAEDWAAWLQQHSPTPIANPSCQAPGRVGALLSLRGFTQWLREVRPRR
jgi:hypothetical protein